MKTEVTLISPEGSSGADNACGTTRDERGRFKTGNIGGGRPKGSRNKLSDVLLSVIVDDFVEYGADAVARLRERDPATYLRLVASLVPRELILQREEQAVSDYVALTDAEVVEMLENQKRQRLISSALKAI
jgi:hypothetical protein